MFVLAKTIKDIILPHMLVVHNLNW